MQKKRNILAPTKLLDCSVTDSAEADVRECAANAANCTDSQPWHDRWARDVTADRVNVRTARASDAAGIDFRRLSKACDIGGSSVRVLDYVDSAGPRVSFFALVGPSGCGAPSAPQKFDFAGVHSPKVGVSSG